jgi:hypothetical protein
MREALRHAASALKAAEVPYALAGSYALWVYGGPEGVHDVDLVVPESSVEDAARTLAEAGFVVERPPEDWLFKAWWDGAMVDILHRLVGLPVDHELLASAEPHDVLGIRMHVLEPTVVITTKLLSLTERDCNFSSMLGAVRSIRERVDWDAVATACIDHPYAEAFLYLLGRLDIIDTKRPE